MMIASCCASFCPKYALSGVTMLKSLPTTVHTPLKCTGLVRPQSAFGRPVILINDTNPSAYISSGSGLNMISAPVASQSFASASRSLG